ncbi:MAG: hypothetical protein RRY55_02960 [Bacteroidales bacterium]
MALCLIGNFLIMRILQTLKTRIDHDFVTTQLHRFALNAKL